MTRGVLLTLALAALLPGSAAARTWHVAPDVAAGDSLARRAVESAAAGDTVVLAAGVHRGPLRIARAIRLRGEPGAVVHGGGRGTVIEVGAAGAVVESLVVRGSGPRVLTIDSGIHVINAGGVEIAGVRLDDVLYGIYAERSNGLRIAGCRLEGRVDPLDEQGEGNGIHLWYCRDTRIEGCDVQRFLDGIYLSFADSARVERTRSHHAGRYGLHTMYCQQNTFARDTLTRNAAGCAIMFSNHLEVVDCEIIHNRGPRTYGLLLRDCSDGWFHRLRLVDNTIAVFMDGSNRNRIADNLVQDNGWGLLLFASCADNVVARNDFLNDDYAVALDMRRTRNAFDDGREGNYWSDATPYDLDGDGHSDVPFSPVTAFSFVSKQYPDLSVLMKSPAVVALGVAERVFPVLRPSEAIDRYPRLRPASNRRREVPGAEGEAARPAWGAFTLCGGALGAGLMAMRRGRQS